MSIMKKFIVKIPEIHISFREVEAFDEQEAMEVANEYEEFALDYTYQLGEEEWEVEEKKT